jgi:hypothetical protein
MIIYDVRAKDLSNGHEFDTLVAEDESADPDLPEWEDREDYLYDNFGLHDDDIHHYFNAGEIGDKDKIETDDFEYKIVGMRWKGVD